MNSKIIKNGNAFYETDDECMEKKAKTSSAAMSQTYKKNNINMNKSGLFSYKSPRK